MKKSDCRKRQIHWSAYIDNLLAPAERDALEKHGEKCAECRAYRAELETLHAFPKSNSSIARAKASHRPFGLWILAVFVIGAIFLFMMIPRQPADEFQPAPVPVASSPAPVTPAEGTSPAIVKAPAPPVAPAITPVPAPAKPTPVEATPSVSAAPKESEPSKPASQPPVAKAESELWKGISSGITTARQLVIQDHATWEALWNEHVSNRTPAPPTPSIDFSQNYVVAIFAGEKPSGGHTISVTSIEETPTEVVVNFKETVPAPGSLTTAAFTQPYQLYLLPKTALPIRFNKL